MRFGGKDELQYSGLCRVLSRRDRLGVDVDGGTQRGMPQEFLHDFEFSPYVPQQRRVGVTKCVPANSLFYPNSLRDWSDNPPKDCLPPIRMAPAMALIGKNPVVRFSVFAAVSPTN
jgi:hypothetical protein